MTGHGCFLRQNDGNILDCILVTEIGLRRILLCLVIPYLIRNLDLPTRGILTTCLCRNDGNSSFPSSRVIAAQVLLTVLDYTEYGEIARNNFGILEDLPHTQEIDSTEDDEEGDPECLVSHLVRYSHDARDRERDDDLDDIFEL